MIKAAVIGASGYTGLELLRLLSIHPDVEISFVTSRQYRGQKVQEIFPAFRGLLDCVFVDPSGTPETPLDIVFTALPHGESMKVVPEILKKGIKVIDLSADFRLRRQALYEKFYGSHGAPELLKDAVYGIPELHRERIKGAGLIANPGCYAIASILALAPLAKTGIIKGEAIIDAKSGVSGAGRTPTLTTSFVEVNEAFRPYKVAEHRHIPEIEQEINMLSQGKDIRVIFVPHLLPVNRGILATIYVRGEGVSEEELYELYTDFYRGEQFMHILPQGRLPDIAYVRGSNDCLISLKVDGRSGRIIILVAIDNLGKGSAGNAVQNMNIVFGFPERRGLTSPFYP